jgi:vancomycin permeability regulator SanA
MSGTRLQSTSPILFIVIAVADQGLYDESLEQAILHHDRRSRTADVPLCTVCVIFGIPKYTREDEACQRRLVKRPMLMMMMMMTTKISRLLVCIHVTQPVALHITDHEAVVQTRTMRNQSW